MIINKYNSSSNKQSESRGSGSGGSVYSSGGGGGSSSQSQQTVAADELWKKGNAQGSLVPKDSYNITEGINSVAIGTDTQTTNEGELAIGTYNISTPDMTIFSIGDGTDREHRHNFLEMNGTGTTTLNSSLNVTNNITTPKITATTGIFGNVDADNVDTDTLNVALRAFIKELTSEEITTEFLTVTKSAHFFELIIDKIKASGGAAIFTPADGFKIADMSHVIPVTNGYVLTYLTNDGNRAIRNMWQEGDQAICMSFNEAQVGTSYNVRNKYYWCLVTRAGTLTAGDTITDVNGNDISFDEDRHFIQISTQSGNDSNGKPYYEGLVNPETGDEIVMLGYRGTDDANRQSAIYISAYSSMDPGIRAPFIAHYKGINDFNLATHRKTWFAANSSQITGNLKIQTNDGDLDVQTAIENNKTYIHTAYCNTVDNSDNSFSKTYFTGAVYMGTAYTSSESEDSLTFNDYAPWVRIKGEDGQNGTDGMGIEKIEEWYYATSSSTTPTFNQRTWTKGSIPSNYNETNKYLWNVEIAIYSDGSKADPTNPQMLGVFGKDGRGIQSITEYYKKSPNISGVLNTDSGWSTTVPTIDSTDRYLWNYELITFSDSTTSKTPAVMIGVFAEDGRSINQVNEWYYVTSSDTPVPTFNEDTWSCNSIPDMDSTNSYLWNVEEIEYSDDTEYTSPALIGHFGTDGRGIQSITEYYKKSTNMEGETNTSLSGWSTTVPTMDQTNKYLWNFERITYTDGSHSDTTPALIGVYTVGEDGKYTQFIFKYSDTQPETPSGQTIPPSGWMTTVTGTGGSSTQVTNPLGVTRTSGTFTSTNGKWKSPTISDGEITVSTFSFTLSTACQVIIKLEASSESNYDFGVAGLLDDTSRLSTLTASSVKSNISNTTYFKGAVSGTQTLDVVYECSAGSHVIQIGYYKDSSQNSNSDCVYASFYTAQQQSSGQQLWMSFAVVDKGVVGQWSYPVPFIGKDGRDGADGRDGTNGTNGTNGKDAIAYYLSQSSGTVTYANSTFTPSTITLNLVRSDRGTPIVDTIVKQGCNATYSSGVITVTPTSTTQGGYFEVTCLNDDGTTWGTLRYSYNLITKSFVSEIVEDQMTNYATKTELNSLGQTVNSYNSSWQQSSESISGRVTAIEGAYVTQDDLNNINLKTNLFTDANFSSIPEYWGFYHLTHNPSGGWYKGSVTTSLQNSTNGAKQIYIAGTTNTTFYLEQPIVLLPNTTYTLSFLYRDLGNSTSPLRFAFYSENSSSSLPIIQSVQSNSTLRWSQYDSGDKAYEFTFRCPSSTSSYSRCYATFTTSTSLPSPIYFWLFSYAGSTTSVRNMYIAELQLEENSTYTTWTPNVRYNYSLINQKADNIKLEVSDGLKETGINIDTNKITLTADNTVINGRLTLYQTTNDGFRLNATDDNGTARNCYVTAGMIDDYATWNNKAAGVSNCITALGSNGFEFISTVGGNFPGNKAYIGDNGITFVASKAKFDIESTGLYQTLPYNNNTTIRKHVDWDYIKYVTGNYSTHVNDDIIVYTYSGTATNPKHVISLGNNDSTWNGKKYTIKNWSKVNLFIAGLDSSGSTNMVPTYSTDSGARNTTSISPYFNHYRYVLLKPGCTITFVYNCPPSGGTYGYLWMEISNSGWQTGNAPAYGTNSLS